jgi:hypothetical protein
MATAATRAIKKLIHGIRIPAKCRTLAMEARQVCFANEKRFKLRVVAERGW